MGIFTKIDGYVKQVAIFLRDGENEKAYNLSKEIVSSFPTEMVSHYLLAKSAFRMGKYDEASLEGRKAFNLAKQKDDSITCALLIASSLYFLGKYDDGYRLLLLYEKENNELVDQMLLIFSVAKGDANAASKHAQELMRINRKAANVLISSFIK